MSNTKNAATGLIIFFAIAIISSAFIDEGKQKHDNGDANAYALQEKCNIGNPYDSGSGHYAGYEWADDNDPSDCDSNSDSFNEGCEEYLMQMSCLQREALRTSE